MGPSKSPRLLLLSFTLLTAAHCIAGGISRTPDGIIVYPSHTHAVRLQVVTNNIIRVLSNPQGEPSMQTASLIITGRPDPAAQWEMAQNDSEAILTTRLIKATVNLSTGAVRFADVEGHPITAEKAIGGRSFESAVFEGSPSWHLRQTFETQPDEALYGLGQHQDGLANYKGYRVDLFQNNTEVAVPFLLSSRNYGILWDNYSVTAVGDIRSYQPLSALRLFSENGDEGWLTATYHNDNEHSAAANPALADLTLPASDIAYDWLGDSKKLLPATFNPAQGTVTWTGAMASGTAGLHTFRVKYAGYIKVYIDGRLQLDRWRQSWNPGSALIRLPMQKDQKVPITIEWTPDGTESYLSVKWLGPLPAGQENDVSFDSEAGNQLDYYFIYGNNLDGVIKGYRYLTGKATMVPKWAMGLWQSRERYKTQAEILNTVKEFRSRHIPLDNIVLDWNYWRQDEWGSQEFDPARFPSPDSMIAVLHNDYHTHFMISVWPKFYAGIETYKDFDKNHWLYKRNGAELVPTGHLFAPFIEVGSFGVFEFVFYRKSADVHGPIRNTR